MFGLLRRSRHDTNTAPVENQQPEKFATAKELKDSIHRILKAPDIVQSECRSEVELAELTAARDRLDRWISQLRRDQQQEMILFVAIGRMNIGDGNRIEVDFGSDADCSCSVEVQKKIRLLVEDLNSKKTVTRLVSEAVDMQRSEWEKLHDCLSIVGDFALIEDSLTSNERAPFDFKD